MTGAGQLIRIGLRADRIRLLIWAVAIWLITAGSVRSEAQVFDNPGAQAARAELIASPAATALAGPGYGLDDYTLGAMVANELLGWVALPVALMSAFLAVRQLRAAEESGSMELVRAAPVGRTAAVPAAMTVVLIADLVIGAGLVVVLVAAGLALPGAIAFGAGVAGLGLVFGAAGACAAQLAARARTASAVAATLVGVGYLLRAVGDVQARESGSVWSWLSPFGWAQATRAWVDERWWPLLLLPVAAVLLTAGAGLVAARRDLGSALLPDRSGRATASPRLRGLAAVTLRRQGSTLLAWALGSAALCALVGVLARQVLDFIAEEPELAQLLSGGASGSATDPVFARYLVLATCLAAAAGVSGVAALHTEETSGRAGHVLAGPVGRTRWMLAQVVVPFAGSALVLVIGGLAMGLAAAGTLDDPGQIPHLTAASLVTLPVVWSLTGLTALLIGWLPRLLIVGWAYLGYVALAGMLAGLLPEGTDRLSVLRLVPALPGDAMDWAPTLGLGAAALVLFAAGVAGFRRRDLLA
ncbi:ABC transporter permease [Cellulomonas denverensis]|uniref:Anibiotic ABC transporter n=1 Tax=Cellulomonas denverensis TaxID=264297 RepID=A0A7X6KSN4_9CELL|nr:anibiotic ABC transporter [Cellulomonas denverensis]NKY21423.1 anibiotic ABC transporter [Cellulomonas denverensis]GIG26629.1 exporter of polyketide antibiotics [Cellulomonas denverensis]